MNVPPSGIIFSRISLPPKDISHYNFPPNPLGDYKDATAALIDPELDKLTTACQECPESGLADLVHDIGAYLNALPIHIPSTTTPDLPSKFWHAIFAIIGWKNILLRCEKGNSPRKGSISPAWRRTIDATLHEWPNICRWLEYLAAQCITDPAISSLHAQSRVFVIATICGFFYPCFEYPISHHSDLRRVVSVCAATLACQFWFLRQERPESLGPYFSANPVSLMQLAINAMEDKTKIGELLKKRTGRKIREIATLCVAQLDVKSDSITDGDLLRCLVLMALCMDDETLTKQLIQANATRAIVKVLKRISNKPYQESTRALDVPTLESCCKCIARLLYFADGITEIIRALEAGFIPAMLRTGPWFPFLQEPHAFVVLLHDVLPAHLIYISVLRATAIELKRVEKLGLEDSMRKLGLLWSSWTLFKKEALDRIHVAGPLLRRVCNNTKCNRTDPHAKFPLCEGCLECYYCSRDCQRWAWENGSHRTRCKAIQAFRRGGPRVAISDEDTQFAISILKHELCKDWKRLALAWHNRPQRRPILSCDFWMFPIKISAESDEIPDSELPDFGERQDCVLVLLKLSNALHRETIHFLISPGDPAYDAEGSLEKLRKAMTSHSRSIKPRKRK